MSTKAKPAAAEYGPGDVVVLRNLRENPNQPNSAKIGPRIAQIARLLPGGRLFVRLHLGGAFTRSTHFAKRGRICELACVARLATQRETTLGVPIALERTQVAA